jgi:hypothetical protein
VRDRFGSVVSIGMERPIGVVGGGPVRRHRTARSGMMEGRDGREGFVGLGARTEA